MSGRHRCYEVEIAWVNCLQHFENEGSSDSVSVQLGKSPGLPGAALWAAFLLSRGGCCVATVVIRSA
jgi:hypothetical protein